MVVGGSLSDFSLGASYAKKAIQLLADNSARRDVCFIWPGEAQPCSVGAKTCDISVIYLFPLRPRPFVPDFGFRLLKFGDGKA